LNHAKGISDIRDRNSSMIRDMFKKKSLGQHFLRDPKILGKIVAAGKLTLEDSVLEIGPGEGGLTMLLLAKVRKVVAVEKDDRLIPILRERFASEIASGRLELIHADILDFSPTNYSLLATNYKVVANIPYYITGALMRKFLQEGPEPCMMVLLVQKEVARRIVAQDGRESILSISVKAYGTPRYVDTVKAGSFSPPPNVDSAIIAIEGISKEFFTHCGEKKFFALLKKGFAHPRKLLASNLGIETGVLETAGIAPNARAEVLSPEAWKDLATKILDGR